MEDMSHNVHIVEQELGVLITPKYPLMKFFNQLEEIKWYYEKGPGKQKTKIGMNK